MDSSSARGGGGGGRGHRFPLEPRPLSRTSARYPAPLPLRPLLVRDSNENPENLERNATKCQASVVAGSTSRRRDRIPPRVLRFDGPDPMAFVISLLSRIFPRLLRRTCVTIELVSRVFHPLLWVEVRRCSL